MESDQDLDGSDLDDFEEWEEDFDKGDTGRVDSEDTDGGNIQSND